MDTYKIIRKYYNPKSKAYGILVKHSRLVAKKALDVAKRSKRLNPDIKFIREAAMLHDIGIFLTDEPRLHCYGKEYYIRHGVLGRGILEKEGFPRHALVCERHVGVGISKQDIIKQKLPLPKRDMMPVSVEEKIICYADKLFSKKDVAREKTISDARKEISRYGRKQTERFDDWVRAFKG